MRPAALLAASLIVAAHAAASPVEPFVDAFGDAGVSVLASRGYLVLQGRRGPRRLAAVHWKALEALSAAADSCRRLSTPPLDGPNAGLEACRALPDDGAVTPGLHLLAAALTASREESWALKSSSASLTEPAGLKNLFETPWGRGWSLRRRADRAEDPAPLAKSFFDEHLAGIRPAPEAARHFIAVTTARGASGVPVRLAEDAAHGAASEELRAWLRRYLRDERRRRGLTLAQDRVKSLLSDKSVLRELAELDALAAALSAKPGLLGVLETALSAGPAASGEPRLLSAGLHLQESTRLGQHELGDEAVVSGAYWVDGLPEGASAEVEETTFLETSRGFSALETRSVKRRNGGPYAYSRGLVIDEAHPFAFRVVISASSGTVVAERAEVPVGPDYGLAVDKEAEALSHSLSCDPKSAEAAYAALEALVGESAAVKPQYKTLLERTRKGRAKAAAETETLARLEEAVAASRTDAAPQQCHYDAARTDAAIKLARLLPAGCDRVLPELFAQRAAISRRSADQAWFLKTSAEARALRRSCDFDGAAQRWAQALAVLEADPAARCGKVAEEATLAEAGLAETQVSIAWTASLEKTLVKAETETIPAKKLESVLPARARLASLPDRDCRRDALKRASRLSDAAGDGESGPADEDALRRLPRETLLASAVEEVRRSRAKLLEKSDAAAQPPAVPSAATPEPVPAAKTSPAPAKPKPAASKRKAKKRSPAKPQAAP